MPSPSSFAISSDIGHGRGGMRSGLRTLKELLEQSACQRHVWVELRPGHFVEDAWTATGGANDPYTWTPGTWPTFDGVPLQPLLLECDDGIVERAARDGEISAGLFTFDGSTITAEFPGNANPNNLDVSVKLGVFVGTAQVIHPHTFWERLDNADLEDFTGGNPDDWSIAGSGTVVASKNTDPYSGSGCLRLTLTNAAANDYRHIYQSGKDTANGQWYVISGFYRGSITAGAASVRLVFRDFWSTMWLLDDGVSHDTSSATAGDFNAETGGEWRHFTYLCKVPWADGDGIPFFQVVADENGTYGTVDLDKLSMRHCVDVPYLPLLTLEGVPYVESARADAHYGPVSTGIGNLRLANGGTARLEALLGAYDWLNAEALVRVGGRFQGGNDIPLSDAPIFARGRVTRPVVEDTEVLLELEDQGTILQTLLPFGSFTAVYGAQDNGRPRALVLGDGIPYTARPTLVYIESNGCGQYEVCDPSYTSAGESSGLPSVYAFIDSPYQEKTSEGDGYGGKLLSSGAGNDVTSSARTGAGIGRITILRHVKPIIVTQDNEAFDFDIGGAQLTAFVNSTAPRTRHSPAGLCSYLQGQMNAVAGVANITVTLSTTTHKVTIARAAGTLNLLCNTGTNRDRSGWAAIGFQTSADRTGAGSYLGDDALYSAGDIEEHRLRMYTEGVCDDSAGTYTGTPYAALSYDSELVHYLLGAVFKLTDDEIDVASFVTARNDATNRTAAALYVGAGDQTISFGELLEMISTNANADVRRVDGRWTWVWRESTAEPGIVDLEEWDYLEFSSGYEAEDLYETVKVGYKQDPWTGHFEHTSTEETSIRIRFGERGQRIFPTSGISDAQAAVVLGRLEDEAQVPRRRVRLSVKGKALLQPVGAQLRLTRSKGLDSTGELDQVLFRIIRKRDDILRWESRVEAIEVV